MVISLKYYCTTMYLLKAINETKNYVKKRNNSTKTIKGDRRYYCPRYTVDVRLNYIIPGTISIHVIVLEMHESIADTTLLKLKSKE